MFRIWNFIAKKCFDSEAITYLFASYVLLFDLTTRYEHSIEAKAEEKIQIQTKSLLTNFIWNVKSRTPFKSVTRPKRAMTVSAKIK